MYRIDFSKPISIHFIGIGGISMSALAEFLHKKGFSVSGSDITPSALTKRLQDLGITVLYPQQAENIPNDCSLVVYTAAVHANNPELVRARERDIPVLERKDLLGQIMQQFKYVVGISGTHGKTTATSMLSLMFIEGGLDPTVLVGGVLDDIGGNLRMGSNDFLVAEACEYCNSFLSFYPTDAIILNIEAEHLDFFRDLEDVRNSFQRYAKLLPSNGYLIINGTVPNLAEFTKDLHTPFLTYGICENSDSVSLYDYTATNLSFDENGFGSYDLYVKGSLLGRVKLHVIGTHNISNSLAAAAIALIHGVSFESICAALLKYAGTHRRFEFKGKVNGVRLYDDYAHHPSEITASLSAARICVKQGQSLWCVFQPHTFSRTKAFLSEIADSLMLADHVVLADIYSASREVDPGDISSKDIMRLLEEKGKDVHYFHDFAEIEKFLLDSCQANDLLITMGAGNITSIADSLLNR